MAGLAASLVGRGLQPHSKSIRYTRPRRQAVLSSTMPRILFLLTVTLSGNFEADAEVRLPKILSSHMVLQRDRPMHFWGWADPDEKVTVTLDGQTAETAADKLGKWSLYLPSHAAGGPFRVDVKGSNALTVDDVMIGDVWFASGQSNMEMPLKGFP